MATSNSYSFSLNKLQILTRALQLINIAPLTGEVDNAVLSHASDKLNMMIKLWEAEGIKLWKRREAVLFTQLNQNSYQIGSVSGADRATNTYVSTTVSANVAQGTNQLTLTDVTGLSDGMNIGLELDSEERQWGTITNINSSTNVVTVSFTTTDTAASGQTVVAYSSLINRPLRILRATYLNLKSSSVEVRIELISYDKYFNLPNKTIAGNPTNAYYSRLINNALPYTGTLFVYPVPNVTATIITFTYLDCIQDMLNNSDDPDFPQEWLYPLIFNLAVELAYDYQKFEEIQILQPKADQLKAVIDTFDADDAPLELNIDWSGMYRRHGWGG